MTLDVGAARINRSGYLRNFATNQRCVPRSAEADSNVGLSFRQIKNPIGYHQFHPQAGMTRVKGIDK